MMNNFIYSGFSLCRCMSFLLQINLNLWIVYNSLVHLAFAFANKPPGILLYESMKVIGQLTFVTFSKGMTHSTRFINYSCTLLWKILDVLGNFVRTFCSCSTTARLFYPHFHIQMQNSIQLFQTKWLAFVFQIKFFWW